MHRSRTHSVSNVLTYAFSFFCRLCVRPRQMGTMLDPKKNSLNDFTVKDSKGKIIKEPFVPMLIEELNVSIRLFAAVAVGVTVLIFL